jgi:hypothetical protein
VPGRSGTGYECGRFSGRGSEWLVIVAESGAGTHAAQGAVSAAHMEFESFEAVLFVVTCRPSTDQSWLRKWPEIGDVMETKVRQRRRGPRREVGRGYTAPLEKVIKTSYAICRISASSIGRIGAEPLTLSTS